MPKWGAGEVYEQTLPADLGPEGQPRSGGSLTKGQILWLRGITRLQTQVCSKQNSLLLTSVISSSLIYIYIHKIKIYNSLASVHVCICISIINKIHEIIQ
jgi:hypothetical protein